MADYQTLLAFIQSEIASVKDAAGSDEPSAIRLAHLSGIESLLLRFTNQQDSLYLTPDDIKDLPKELLNELKLNNSELKDFKIVEIINNLGGMTSIDKLLVELYRATGEIESRTKLTSRLYRMSVRGLVCSHPEKKGIYATSKEALGQN